MTKLFLKTTCLAVFSSLAFGADAGSFKTVGEKHLLACKNAKTEAYIDIYYGDGKEDYILLSSIDSANVGIEDPATYEIYLPKGLLPAELKNGLKLTAVGGPARQASFTLSGGKAVFEADGRSVPVRWTCKKP